MKRRVDYGSIILLLTVLIVGVFAVDFACRKMMDWRGTRKPLEIIDADAQPDSTSDSNPVGTDLTTAQSDPPSTESTTTTAAGGFTMVTLLETELHKGNLILVDAAHPLTDTPATTPFLNITYDHFRLPSKNLIIANTTIEPCVSMFADFYAATGLGNVMIYATMNTTTAAAYSAVIPERFTGLTLDLAVWNETTSSHAPFTGEGKYAWIPEHCADYGYVLRFPEGKTEQTGQAASTWHYRYVGIPHAKYMTEQNLCLEEYLEKLKSYPYDGTHLEVTVDDTRYEIYYVAAAIGASATQVPMPADGSVEYSGDNIGGYIVTIPHSS